MLFGKRIIDTLYVHLDYWHSLGLPSEVDSKIQVALGLLPEQILQTCNVLKFHLRSHKLSLLEYLNFDADPFPILSKAWVFNESSATFTQRSFDEAFNPPILHRKELLVPLEHPKRAEWTAVTQLTESLGLFDLKTPIGFKLNWEKAIADKGYRLLGNEFSPIGNDLEGVQPDAPAHDGQIQRHLTALSRTALSAPVQFLIKSGLITESIKVFDYGCGRGDDLRELSAMGFACEGWDPFYHQEGKRSPADIVNLGFVINVIEDPLERVEALYNAYALAGTALIVSVMLYDKDRPGKPHLDGVITSRNTFQKYFSQEEFKEYLENTLHQEPIMVGPGIALVFSDKEAEQRFLLRRYRSNSIARRLIAARPRVRATRRVREQTPRPPRSTKAQREFESLRPLLQDLWEQALEFGRFPEPYELNNLRLLAQSITYRRALRLVLANFDQSLLARAAETRSSEILLFFAARQFSKRAPYRELEPRLRTDIRYFFGDYKSANDSALSLLVEASDPGKIRHACEKAASDGLGWLENDSHCLQLHISLVERLPAVLRAYVQCGQILWDNVGDFQLVKIHVSSGKLTFLQYQDFDTAAIPVLTRRIKINIRQLDYDIFDYDPPQYPPPPLLFKSRYLHEDLPGYAEQLEFDEKLEAAGITEEGFRTVSSLQSHLERKRLEVSGLELRPSTVLPSLAQPCGQFFTFRDLIECGETQSRLGISNLPLNPDTYNALYCLSTEILDPVVEYFGSIKLTYGFCSPTLAKNISSRIAPKLDQHASHERSKAGTPICDRLGAAVDFLVEDEDMVEVALWITKNLPFDRLYVYGRAKPIHVSLNETPAGQVTLMTPAPSGRLIPRNCTGDQLQVLASKITGF